MLPFLAACFARRRQLNTRQWPLTALPFVVAALVVNLYPYGADSATEILVALDLPVVLLNLALLVNLAGAAWLSARFLIRRTTFHRLERWQTSYLPVCALWATTVVVILPTTVRLQLTSVATMLRASSSPTKTPAIVMEWRMDQFRTSTSSPASLPWSSAISSVQSVRD